MAPRCRRRWGTGADGSTATQAAPKNTSRLHRWASREYKHHAASQRERQQIDASAPKHAVVPALSRLLNDVIRCNSAQCLYSRTVTRIEPVVRLCWLVPESGPCLNPRLCPTCSEGADQGRYCAVGIVETPPCALHKKPDV